MRFAENDLDNRIPAGHAAFFNSFPYTRFGYTSPAFNLRHTNVPYAAIDLKTPAQTEAEVIASPPSRPVAKDATRPDFKVGDRVTFHDRDNIPVTGTVSRINKKTVTVLPDNENGHWRVSAALLNHLVDI